MSDPRIDIVKTAQRLPRGAAIIYRHFGAAGKLKTAQALRQISFEREQQLLIGQDCELAIESGADGVHFPQDDIEQSRLWAKRCPHWILTGATHDGPSLALAAHLPLHAVTLSPVFETQSQGSGEPLGLKLFTQLTRASRKPVIALGGINAQTAPYLIGSGAAGLAGVSKLT